MEGGFCWQLACTAAHWGVCGQTSPFFWWWVPDRLFLHLERWLPALPQHRELARCHPAAQPPFPSPLQSYPVSIPHRPRSLTPRQTDTPTGSPLAPLPARGPVAPPQPGRARAHGRCPKAQARAHSPPYTNAGRPRPAPRCACAARGGGVCVCVCFPPAAPSHLRRPRRMRGAGRRRGAE